ncbi:hypothetical protein [Dactylosporangium cerinum]
MTTLLSRPAPVALAKPDPAPPKRRSRRWIGTLATPVVVFVFSSLLTFGLGALSPSNPALRSSARPRPRPTSPG